MSNFAIPQKEKKKDKIWHFNTIFKMFLGYTLKKERGTFSSHSEFPQNMLIKLDVCPFNAFAL